MQLPTVGTEWRGIILWRACKYLEEVAQIAEILYVHSFIADSTNCHLGLG